MNNANFQTFLVTNSSYSSTDKGKTYYKATIAGINFYPIGDAIPWISTASGKIECKGLARVFEMHITEMGTTVFFTVNTASTDSKLTSKLKEYYLIASGISTQSPAVAKDRDTVKTGVDAATRMMMGETRSPREIGRDERSKGRGTYEDLYGYFDDF